jgi:acetyltransferase-like isoleucine patch superfamily enzyme
MDSSTEATLVKRIRRAYAALREQMWRRYRRHVSFGDLFTDRWETARAYGFGEGTSCYDNVLILGDVRVGRNTWIGPNCVLDGTAGLEIGDYCSISAGVQVYTHSTVRWATSLGAEPAETAPVRIGSGVYIGPQTVIQMGVTIGDQAVIGACSFVNRDIPAGVRAWGCPATIRS